VKWWEKKRKEDAPNQAYLGEDHCRLWMTHATSNLGDGISGVAYPWLASAVTRSPLRIASVAAVSRLPWLVSTLPAGVITDRFDRQKIIVALNLTSNENS
jgi:MFS family permease